eukprot:PhF_6_TR43010/c1_g1_i2/m.65722
MIHGARRRSSASSAGFICSSFGDDAQALLESSITNRRDLAMQQQNNNNTNSAHDWIPEAKNFALALLLRLGPKGIYKVEEMFRTHGAGYGLVSDTFLEVMYVVIREMEMTGVNNAGGYYPWVFQTSTQPTHADEKIFHTNEDVETDAYDLLSEAARIYERVKREKQQQSGSEHTATIDRSRMIRDRRAEEQQSWLTLRHQQRPGYQRHMSIDFFFCRVMLKHSLAVLFDAVDEDEQNVITWEQLGS